MQDSTSLDAYARRPEALNDVDAHEDLTCHGTLVITPTRREGLAGLPNRGTLVITHPREDMGCLSTRYVRHGCGA